MTERQIRRLNRSHSIETTGDEELVVFRKRPCSSVHSRDCPIMTNMLRHTKISKSHSQWRLLLTFMPAAGLTLLPKCPFCLLGILSALGLGTVINVTWLKPLTIALLGIAVASLAISVHRGRGYRHSVLGLLAGIMVFVSKFYLDYRPATYASLAFLFAATMWGAVRKNYSSLNDSDCKSCDQTHVEAGEISGAIYRGSLQ